MFGVANQLLATIALVIGTTFIINRGKVRYAWVTAVPMTFVGFVTIYAGFMNIFTIYIPMLQIGQKFTVGIINIILTAAILISVFIVLVDCIKKWIKTIRTKDYILDETYNKIAFEKNNG